MPYQPIENYGMIGNMRTSALVGMDGSIDWHCFPHFDSPSVFAAILDDQKGGHFKISPSCEGVTHKQYYWPDTNVLVTRFLSPSRGRTTPRLHAGGHSIIGPALSWDYPARPIHSRHHGVSAGLSTGIQLWA